MSKKDDLKIEIMSNIDDDIIEKHTKKRFALMGGRASARARKTTVALVAIVACLGVLSAVMIGLLQGQEPVLPGSDTSSESTAPIEPTGQVPVYQGMTVSNEAPDVEIKSTYPSVSALSSYSGGGLTVLGSVSSTATGTTETESELEIDVEKPDEDPENGGIDRALYFAKPNSDVYIYIHINNPDQFEILSFTLNGLKYQSYMFEPGSDSETLILKVNVGNAGRFVEYTIDAIKYVEGTEIKDVIMDGDKTVRVEITPEEQPTAEISDVACGFLDLSVSVKINDSLSLIKECNGTVQAVLYNGDEIVVEKELNVDETNTVVFEGLVCNHRYTLRIVAHYDAIDGEGIKDYILEELDLETKKLVDIISIDTSDCEMPFDISVQDGYGVLIEKTELAYPDGSVIKSIDGKADGFGVLEMGEYKILITYSYDSDNGRIVAVLESAVKQMNGFAISLPPVVGAIAKEYTGSGGIQIWNETLGEYKEHWGIDINAQLGTPVLAAASGKIAKIWDDAYMGKCISIDHGNGYFTFYKNLDVNIPEGIVVGKEVRRGEKIGTVGRSAYTESVDAPHLHFEMTAVGEYVDPMDYFTYEALDVILNAGKVETETESEIESETE